MKYRRDTHCACSSPEVWLFTVYLFPSQAMKSKIKKENFVFQNRFIGSQHATYLVTRPSHIEKEPELHLICERRMDYVGFIYRLGVSAYDGRYVKVQKKHAG